MSTWRLKGGETTQDRRLGRVRQFDERSRQFDIRSLVPADLPLRGRSWSCKPWLNQGSEGACVGFGWSHELAASPVVVPGITNVTARDLYHQAQRLDEWPGESYEGTSVLAGAKAVEANGHLDEYRWAFTIEDGARTVAQYGPVVIGSWWWNSMFHKRPSGLIECDFSSGKAGGHCYLWLGLRLKTGLPGEPKNIGPLARCRNSWGDGDFWIKLADLERIVLDDGEQCVPVRRR